MRFNPEGEPVKVFGIIKPIKGRVGYAATIFLAAIALGLPGCASNPEADLAVKKVEAQKTLDDLMRQEKSKAELQVILDQIKALQEGQSVPPGKQPKSTPPETAEPANLTCERVLIKLGRPTDGKNDCRELEKFTNQLEERSQTVSTVKTGKPEGGNNNKGGFPWGWILGLGALTGGGWYLSNGERREKGLNTVKAKTPGWAKEAGSKIRGSKVGQWVTGTWRKWRGPGGTPPAGPAAPPTGGAGP